MAFPVKHDEPANPCDVGFFGPATVVPNPHGGADAVEELRFLRLGGARSGGVRHGLDRRHPMTMPSSSERSQLVSI